jgi:hypothetical protein
VKTFTRILAYSVIVTSILSIVLGFFTIISIWRINDPLIRGLSNTAAAAETALQFASNGLEKVDKLVSLLIQAMGDVQKNAEELKSQIENADPIIDTLTLLLGEDARPKLEQAMQTLGAVRGTIETINTATQAINALPFIEVPSITQQTQQIADLFAEIEAAIENMMAMVDRLQEGISSAVIQPIQDQAVIVESDLEAAQSDLQTVSQQVDTAYQIVVAVRPRIPQIITGISLLLSLQLLWSILTQGAAIYLAWFYLKSGSLDLSSKPPELAPVEEQAETTPAEPQVEGDSEAPTRPNE